MPDSIDKEIARLLGQDARQSSEALAKRLKINSATVRRRLRELIRNKLLKIVGVVDLDRFDAPFAVVITLDVDHDKLETALEALAQRSEVRWVSTTTGRFDIIALARFRSNNSLSEFIKRVVAQLDGVKDSETFICMDVRKGCYGILP
ncbi:Lrp/AsnC family transcriptional regulator [Chloroflexota bacterium]